MDRLAADAANATQPALAFASWRSLMEASMFEDLTATERALAETYDVAADLALRCRQLRDMPAPAGAGALDEVVNTLMTEFWDQGFSQTEVRNAFTAALADMNRYAAGRERR